MVSKRFFYTVLFCLIMFKGNGQITSPELQKLQSELIGYALMIAENYNLELDFSDSSIIIVEQILSEINSDYVQTGNEEGLYGIALEFGFYIMKVIEQNHGPAYFERDDKDWGENAFPFYWRDGTMFPVGWCTKRILDGEGDNVWIKYEILVLDKK